MRISTAAINLPFRTAFVHARARRKQTAAVAVRVTDADGITGYGEGCPRDYVTGEDVPGALDWLARHAADWAHQAGTVADLRDLVARQADQIDRHPAAFCALELALLDRLARCQDQSVESLLGLASLQTPLPVTAVLGTDNPLLYGLQAGRFRHAGMTDIKLKLTGNPKRDLRRLGGLKWAHRIRIDGNNLWSDPATAIAALRRFTARIWAVEEPLAPRDLTGLIEVHHATGLAVILDESLTCTADLDALLALGLPPDAFVANLRLSKMGGLLRTLHMAEKLRAAGIGLVLGSQVGETSLLARAGLAVAANFDLKGYEGAYGLHLLARDAFAPSITFGRDGRVDPARLDLSGPGWGLTPSPELTSALDGTTPR